jgi:hypothetical protein
MIKGALNKACDEGSITHVAQPKDCPLINRPEDLVN